jgi:hypothetical protein
VQFLSPLLKIAGLLARQVYAAAAISFLAIYGGTFTIMTNRILNQCSKINFIGLHRCIKGYVNDVTEIC